MPLIAEMRGVMVPEFRRLLRCEILLLVGVEVLLHLLHDMLGLVVILDIEIRRGLHHLIRVPAHGTEFPLLVTVRIRECPASGAADDEVHAKGVIDQ
jgi:hypothetical protein